MWLCKDVHGSCSLTAHVKFTSIMFKEIIQLNICAECIIIMQSINLEANTTYVRLFSEKFKVYK